MDNNAGQNITDQILVKRVLDGDNNAFGIIVKKTENLVAKIVFDTIPNERDRKDIAQDIYLKTFQKLPGFKFQAKLSTWIAQISYNTCIDYLRKKKPVLIETSVNNDNSTEDELLDFLNPSNSRMAETADRVTIEKDLTEIVKTGINKLPAIYKTLISMYHTEELSYDEISTITGLPAGTVKSYLFRARRQLKNELLLYYKKEDLC